MAKNNIKKVCPPVSELSEIKINISCPEEGCNGLFFNSTNLNMHLWKHHKKKSVKSLKRETSEVTTHYHCPVKSCPYEMGSLRFFKCMKYLKQHYLKAHAEKKFRCSKCEKGFPTEAARKYHLQVCGMKFVCSCQNIYGSYEALLTHSKRTLHTFDEKFRICGKNSTQNGLENESITRTHASQDGVSTSTTVALPVRLLAAVTLSELSHPFKVTTHKEVQTDVPSVENKRSRKSPLKVSERAIKRRTSAQTQTGSVPKHKQPKISAQTQTSGDYILKKAMRAADIPISNTSQGSSGRQNLQMKRRRKSMETQTSVKLNPCSNDRDLIDIYTPSSSKGSYILPNLWPGPRSTSSTQTSPGVVIKDNGEMFNSPTVQSDPNLSFLKPGSSNPTTIILPSSSKPSVNLNSYFEDSLPNYEICSLNTSFEQKLGSTSVVESLTSETDGPGYSDTQIENILSRNRKLFFDEIQSCSIETQTELEGYDCLLSQCVAEEDESFTVCSNIETQTTEEISSFDHLLYSNMCTQTCDDMLFPDFDFSSIETQDDDSTFVSAETQTSFCAGLTSSFSDNASSLWFGDKPSSYFSEMSHMETQTDLEELKNLIEELSSDDTNDKIL